MTVTGKIQKFKLRALGSDQLGLRGTRVGTA
jgi:hypothetical protein